MITLVPSRKVNTFFFFHLYLVRNTILKSRPSHWTGPCAALTLFVDTSATSRASTRAFGPWRIPRLRRSSSDPRNRCTRNCLRYSSCLWTPRRSGPWQPSLWRARHPIHVVRSAQLPMPRSERHRCVRSGLCHSHRPAANPPGSPNPPAAVPRPGWPTPSSPHPSSDERARSN